MTGGLWFALLAMLLWGAAPLFGKLGLIGIEPLPALAIRSAIVTAVLALAVTVLGKWPAVFAASAKETAFIGAEGLCAALLGQLAYYYALKLDAVSRVSPVAAAFPLVSAILAIILLGEKLTLTKIAGAFFIVTGIILLKM